MGKTRPIGKIVVDTIKSVHPWKSGKGYWAKAGLFQYVVFPEDNVHVEPGKTYELEIYRTFFRNNYCIRVAKEVSGEADGS